MKLIYNGKRLVNSRDCGYDIDTDFRQAGLTLYQCVEAGFIVAEIFHAKRNPCIWHDYSRSTKPESEALPPGVRTESEVIADLTKQRDALLEVCRTMRKRITRLAGECESPLAKDWLDSMEFANMTDIIVLAEPGESK